MKHAIIQQDLAARLLLVLHLKKCQEGTRDSVNPNMQREPTRPRRNVEGSRLSRDQCKRKVWCLRAQIKETFQCEGEALTKNPNTKLKKSGCLGAALQDTVWCGTPISGKVPKAVGPISSCPEHLRIQCPQEMLQMEMATCQTQHRRGKSCRAEAPQVCFTTQA